jgi:hypothetical protein
MLSAAKRLNESGGGGASVRHDELAIDSLDPDYHTVADGDRKRRRHPKPTGFPAPGRR